MINQFAESINGRYDYFALSKDEIEAAKKNNLVVVYGQSDDIMTFWGAINNSLSCYGGGEAFLLITDKTMSIIGSCECGDVSCHWCFTHTLIEKGITNYKAIPITAVWKEDGEPCWLYKTSIPHVKFNILDDYDDTVYCQGIVFSLDNLASANG